MVVVHVVSDLFEGFWTYQTPISFLAGVGAYHIYCRMSHKNCYRDYGEADVREEG